MFVLICCSICFWRYFNILYKLHKTVSDKKTPVNKNWIMLYKHKDKEGIELSHTIPVTPGGRGTWTLTGCKKVVLGVWERQRRGLTWTCGSPHSAWTSGVDTWSTYRNGNTKKPCKLDTSMTHEYKWTYIVGLPVKLQCGSAWWSVEGTGALFQGQRWTPAMFQLMWESNCPLLVGIRP